MSKLISVKAGIQEARESVPVTYLGETVYVPPIQKPLDALYGYSIRGQSQNLRNQMLDDVFVLEGIAILGQWTTLYAAPNTGKTLITLKLLTESIKKRIIDPEAVFYINADDNIRGLADKSELAEEYGFHMLAPNHNGFKASFAVDLIRELSNTDDALGTIIILDTLKKFTDLMDKRKATEFGDVIRDFVSAGGTVIGLAHTNKHKSADGKSVFAGTSDIRDDSDCAFIIDRVVDSEAETVIEFTMDKNRGDVDDKVGFSYTRVKGQSYRSLFDSVVRLEQGSVQNMRGQAEVARKLAEDDEAIVLISEAIVSGTVLKTEIVKYVNSQSGLAQRTIKDILDRRTGTIYELGHRWRSTREEHNRHRYELLSAPSLNNCKTEKLTK